MFSNLSLTLHPISYDLIIAGMMTYFAEEFGFSSTEVVALMGVHTLGEARAANTGFVVRIRNKLCG